MTHHRPWGILTSLDLQQCDAALIRDAEAIKQYVIELCDLINVKRFGDCTVVHFGEREEIAGYSFTQLIETSLVSGHLANATNTAYIDVFSCSHYDSDAVADFTKKFFKAAAVKITVLHRN